MILTMPSCGIVRFRNAPSYHAGSPYKKGYEQKGLVEEVTYDCSVPGPSQRRMIVYLPHDYYQDLERYPVFYLLHGARGYETSWIRKGAVYESTDSLVAAGLAVPCIVVMPNVNQYNDDNDYDDGRYKDAFESIFEVDGKVERAFLHDVVEYVDSVYRTVPESTHRAISGLSIGGHQSLHLAAFYPYTFSYIGAYSPYWWSLGKLKHRRLFYRDFKELLATQFKINPPIRYYLMTGDVDIVRPSTAKFCRYLDKKGYEHEYVILPGGHDWPCWKANLILMMENAFKGKETNEN